MLNQKPPCNFFHSRLYLAWKMMTCQQRVAIYWSKNGKSVTETGNGNLIFEKLYLTLQPRHFKRYNFYFEDKFSV